MKKIILMLFMFMILSINVFAIDGWEQYLYDDSNTGIYKGSYEGLFDDGIESFSYNPKGDDTQPIFIDIDNDSIKEYITMNNNNFIIYNVSLQNKLQIEYEISTGFSVDKYFMTTYKDKIYLLADDLTFYTNKLYVAEYEWINDTLYRNNYTLYDLRDMSSGISCDYISQLGGDYCFFYAKSGSGGVMPYFARYNISGNVVDAYQGGQFVPRSETYKIAPIIADLNNNGIKYVYMGGGGGGDKASMSYSIPSTLQSGTVVISNDGFITGMSIHDVDGGFKEIMISYYENSGTETGRITIRNHVLSEIYNIRMISNPNPSKYDTDISNCLYEDFYGDTNKEICCAGHLLSSNDSTIVIGCAIPSDSYALYKFLETYNIDEKYYFYPHIPIISAKMRININDKYSIVTGSSIFFLDENKVISYDSEDPYGINGLNFNFPIITDINNDGLIDICESGSGETFCAFNSFENQNAFYIGSFGATTPRKEEQGESNTVIYEDVCINSIHTFFTAECTESESYRCNYVNDINSDTERLLLTCPDGTDINTSFNNNEINFSCNFSTLGSYKFPIFLQDNHHSSDLDEFKYVKINVVNGSKYIDCDLATNIYDKLPLNETETIQDDPKGSDDIQTGNTDIGDYCFENSDCKTGKCENHICVYRLFNEPCISDDMCLSGKCINGRCNKPSISQLANQARKENFGSDDATNIIIGMLVCLGGMFLIIIMGKSLIACIIGVIWYFISSTAFVLLQWMPSFIFFINIFIGVITIILYLILGKRD